MSNQDPYPQHIQDALKDSVKYELLKERLIKELNKFAFEGDFSKTEAIYNICYCYFTTKDWYEALLNASYGEHIEILEFIIKGWWDTLELGLKDFVSNNKSLIETLCKKGCLKMIKYFLKIDGTWINVQNAIQISNDLRHYDILMYLERYDDYIEPKYRSVLHQISSKNSDSE